MALTGFQVTLDAGGRAEFQVFGPRPAVPGGIPGNLRGGARDGRGRGGDGSGLLPREPARPAPARRGAGGGVRRGPGVGRVPVPRGGGARRLEGEFAAVVSTRGRRGSWRFATRPGRGPCSGPTRGGPSGSAPACSCSPAGCAGQMSTGASWRPSWSTRSPSRRSRRRKRRLDPVCRVLPGDVLAVHSGGAPPGSSTGTGSSGPPTSGR